MQNSNEQTVKEAELRGNNIINSEKSLVGMYASFLSVAREGTMKLELYTLLNDQKEILDEIESEIPKSQHN
jgi:hypothetical protein